MGLSWNITKIRTTPLFFKIDLCSATSMESSRRDLLNDMAEHRPILKHDKNTHYSLIFQDRPMFSHINGKLSPRPFEWYKLNMGLSWNITKIRPTPLFFKIDLCSATPMESSRRDFLNHMAEQGSSWKVTKIRTACCPFITPKTVKNSLKQRCFVFTVVNLSNFQSDSFGFGVC